MTDSTKNDGVNPFSTTLGMFGGFGLLASLVLYFVGSSAPSGSFSGELPSYAVWTLGTAGWLSSAAALSMLLWLAVEALEWYARRRSRA